jgi:hypothetical protein
LAALAGIDQLGLAVGRPRSIAIAKPIRELFADDGLEHGPFGQSAGTSIESLPMFTLSI